MAEEPMTERTPSEKAREIVSFVGMDATCAHMDGGDCAVCRRRNKLIAAITAALTDAAQAGGEIRALVNKQAEDAGLWFIAATAPEAYLQQELRSLHALIENTLDGTAQAGGEKRYPPIFDEIHGSAPCGCSYDDVGSTLLVCLKHSDERCADSGFFDPPAAREEKDRKLPAGAMSAREFFEKYPGPTPPAAEQDPSNVAEPGGPWDANVRAGFASISKPPAAREEDMRGRVTKDTILLDSSPAQRDSEAGRAARELAYPPVAREEGCCDVVRPEHCVLIGGHDGPCIHRPPAAPGAAEPTTPEPEQIRLRYRTDTIEGCERAVIDAAKAWATDPLVDLDRGLRHKRLFIAIAALDAAEAKNK